MTETKTITRADIANEFVKLTEEVGETFQYRSPIKAASCEGEAIPGDGVCVYVDPETDAPSCAIGRILATFGVPIQLLKYMDNSSFSGIGYAAAGFLKTKGFALTDDAVELAKGIQIAQDRGAAYGEIVRVYGLTNTE